MNHFLKKKCIVLQKSKFYCLKSLICPLFCEIVYKSIFLILIRVMEGGNLESNPIQGPSKIYNSSDPWQSKSATENYHIPYSRKLTHPYYNYLQHQTDNTRAISATSTTTFPTENRKLLREKSNGKLRRFHLESKPQRTKHEQQRRNGTQQ